MNFLYNQIHNFLVITSFVDKVFPCVDQELTHWHNYAYHHCCPELKEQALSSIKYKKFHCQGGNIYSLYPGVDTKEFVPLVVALQTISDYLDNLCDRTATIDEKAFRKLHQAMADALDPDSTNLEDYYAFYPLKEDGGYLKELVKTCQQQVKKLPSYSIVKPELKKLVLLYSDLQTYKHLSPSIREDKMTAWIDEHHKHHPQISQWEFAAATGSTLGMFMLCAAASDKNLTSETAENIATAYFPWISGLHILLDYFIDSSEDQANGDLNFVAYYTNQAQTISRLTLFTTQAFKQASNLPQSTFHRIVIQGLLAMYLSDPKSSGSTEQTTKKSLLKVAGMYTRFIYYLCKLLRLWKKL
jgi:tetraprenyl-beta-curcumene synthase